MGHFASFLHSLQKYFTGVSYTYSSDGTRLTKTVNGVKTSYTWDGAQLVSQKTGNEAIYFLYHSSSRVGLEYKGNTYYYIYNLQGDVVGLVNSNGTTVVSYTYDAWGNPESITGSMASTLGAANPFRYRSYYFDTESGLYYLMSRYYDPVVGRFLNADEVIVGPGSVQGTNLFQYCFNNPIFNCDNNGNWPHICTPPPKCPVDMKKIILNKYEFNEAYKAYTGEDYTLDDKYIGYTVSKSTIKVGKYDDLYAQVITYLTTAALSAYCPPLGVLLDISMLISPEDPIPYGTYTQYTITLYERPTVLKEPIKHGGYITGYNEVVYNNSLTETYLVGPGNAGFLVKTGSYYYDDQKTKYYQSHPWARR